MSQEDFWSRRYRVVEEMLREAARLAASPDDRLRWKVEDLAAQAAELRRITKCS